MAVSTSTQYPWQQQPQQSQPQAPQQTNVGGTAGLASQVTSAQLLEAGAQAGIDFSLNAGPNADLSSWLAQERGILLRSGFSQQQVDTYLNTATAAFKSAISHESAAAGGGAAGTGRSTGTSGAGSTSATGAGTSGTATSGAGGSSSAGTPGLSYGALVAAVGQDVLPAGNNLEPQPIGAGAAFTQDDKAYGDKGTSVGASLPLTTNLAQLIAGDVATLQRANATPHQIAVYVQSVQAAFQAKTTQATAGGSGSTGATSTGPDLTSTVSSDFQAWYTNTAAANSAASAYTPSPGDWQKLVTYATQLKSSQPDQYQALVTQLNKSHSDWSANLSLAVNFGSSDPDAAAKTYTPLVGVLPGLKTGDSGALVVAHAITNPSSAKMNANDYFALLTNLIHVRQNNGDDAYLKIVNQIADPNLKTAVNNWFSQNWNNGAPPDFAKINAIKGTAFAQLNDGKGNWKNGATADQHLIPTPGGHYNGQYYISGHPLGLFDDD